MQPIGSTVFFNFILAPSTSRRFKFHERGQLSLACITKRFLSSRCASAILIVRRYSVKSGATLRGKCGRLANHGSLGCHGLGSAGFQRGCFGWASQNNLSKSGWRGLRLNAKNTPPLQFFLKRDAPASKGPDFPPNAIVIALAASVRPHNTSDSDRPWKTGNGRTWLRD